jgi:LysR family transcriptional regulator of gallate degradation
MATFTSLRALRAIAAVASTGGVAGAARALHQSPSSVSRAVQGAEALLGIALFDRGTRGMTPTPAGQVLALRAARALEALQAAADGLRLRGAPATAASLPRLASDALLQAFVARAAHTSEAAAAASIGLSQAALHHALRRLEHAARAPLFERTRVGARLNESGRFMLQQAQIALAEIRIGHEELARWRGKGGSHVAIGALPMAGDVLVPQAIAIALRECAGVQLTVKDGTYESLTQMLRAADVDLIVGPLRGAALAGDLAEEVLLVDRFVAVVRAGHPALRSKRSAKAMLGLDKLAPYPWIGPLPGTPAQRVFERLFASAGLPAPQVIVRTHSTAVTRSVLLDSDAVALVSPLQVRAEVKAGLLVHASAPLAESERAIGITQRRGALPSSACLDVLAAIKTVAATTTSTVTGKTQ